MKLAGKTALVTGGAVRIGRAICLALARERVDVVVHYHRSAREATALCRELRQLGSNALAIQANLNTEKACEALIRQVIRKTGRLDILVNNAAVFHKDRLKTMTVQKLLAEFWPNLFAPIILTREFSLRVRRGKIINILDRRISGHDPSCFPYVLSKKAMAEVTALAALELAPGITVNAVAPGAILPPPGKGKNYLRDMAGPVPLKKQCTPDDVAAAVISLLKSEAITGQTIYVDGGQHLLSHLNS